MKLTKRKVLLLVGGGAIVAAGAGAMVASRTPSKAAEPWSRAGSYGDIRRNALSWALLAPNPHNLQPWKAQLVGDDSVALLADPTRSLPHTDPFGRQITIGLGCFTELMRLAAAESGFGVDLDFYPEGENDQAPVVRARFRPNAAQPDPLFGAAANRRTNRSVYDVGPLPPETVAILSESRCRCQRARRGGKPARACERGLGHRTDDAARLEGKCRRAALWGATD
ncbi:MAG: hypothetical protein INF93_18525 [Rhodobacter sp.]|nr:hypothetical protein [Rhodobacter sp.]